jgi:phage shock protein PspC (stress-responsive transcriptional regulator)/uncharacterized integral membrane protein
MSDRKLYKSSTDKMIFGVCGGLGRYFNVDPTVLRIAWVGIALLTLPIGPAGLFIGGLAYLAGYFIMPNNPDEAGLVETQDLSRNDEPASGPELQSNSLIWGIVLVLLALVVLSNTDIVPFHLHWRNNALGALLSMALIGALVYAVIKHRPQMVEFFRGLSNRRLYRLNNGKKLFGVCAGLADSFEVDPTLMRLGWVLGAMFSGGAMVVLYLAMAFIMPVGSPNVSESSFR